MTANDTQGPSHRAAADVGDYLCPSDGKERLLLHQGAGGFLQPDQLALRESALCLCIAAGGGDR